MMKKFIMPFLFVIIATNIAFANSNITVNLESSGRMYYAFLHNASHCSDGKPWFTMTPMAGEFVEKIYITARCNPTGGDTLSFKVGIGSTLDEARSGKSYFYIHDNGQWYFEPGGSTVPSDYTASAIPSGSTLKVYYD